MHRLLQYAFWFAIATTLFFALRKVTIVIPASDKTQHAVTFALLMGFAALAYPRARIWAVAFALSGFGALIEVLQPFFGRDAAIRDWVADNIGIAIALLIAWAIRKAWSGMGNSAL